MTEYTDNQSTPKEEKIHPIEMLKHIAELSIPRTVVTFDIVRKEENGDKVLFIGYGIEGDTETQRCLYLSAEETIKLRDALNEELA